MIQREGITNNLESLNQFADAMYVAASRHLDADQEWVKIPAADLLIWAFKALYTIAPDGD